MVRAGQIACVAISGILFIKVIQVYMKEKSIREAIPYLIVAFVLLFISYAVHTIFYVPTITP